MIHHVLFSGSVIGASHRGRDSSSLYVLDTLRLPSASSAHVSSVVSSSIQLPYYIRNSHSTKPLDLIDLDVRGLAPFPTKGGHK